MLQVSFLYEGQNIYIQCNSDDTMNVLAEKFALKVGINKDSVYYLYQGNKIDTNLALDKFINQEDKSKNLITIMVMKLSSDETLKNNKVINKSGYIICPICKEKSLININNYRASLYNCKNGHNNSDIELDKFEQTQKIDLSEILCDQCKNNNMGNVFKNVFYRCMTCKLNLCPICKLEHSKKNDEKHKIINYDQKDYKCEIHDELYIKYCKDCKLNLCIYCANEHKNHNNILYEDIIPDINNLKNRMKELREEIDIFNKEILKIISILNKVKDNIEIYYNIFLNIINNYGKDRNYEILHNINEIKNNKLLEIIKEINNENKYENKFNSLLNIYKEITKESIKIVYNINKKGGKIKIFGKDFVKNNKNICKIEYENNEYALSEEFNLKDKTKDILEIKLKNANKITNMAYLFSECNSLSTLSELSKWDTSNIINMSYLFFRCNQLEFLPDISNWNTEKVKDMSGMFAECKLLKELPDISKWNIRNVKNLGTIFTLVCFWGIFEECNSLVSLPDISKWDTSNVNSMIGTFSNCSSLTCLPDISKWNTSNVNNMSYMFRGCSSLTSLPDISQWDISNLTDVYHIFENCSSLTSIPDLSKWNIKKIKYKTSMFEGCDKEKLDLSTKFKK